jgi:vacuolar-type H+-ATPase subunit I/STV1
MTGNIETLYASSVKRRKESLGKSHVSSYMSQRYGGDIQDNVSMGKEYRKEMDRLDEEHGVKVYDKQEFLDFESLEKREEKVRKDVEEEIEELKSLKEEKEQAVVKV